MALRIELVESIKRHLCDHCGEANLSVHGFVYRDENAYALYFAQLYTAHPDKLVCLAIGVGDWGEESSPRDRTSVSLFVRPTESEFQMTLTDREASPWRNSSLLGTMMNRADALTSPLKDVLFEIADRVVAEDPRIRSYLAASDTGALLLLGSRLSITVNEPYEIATNQGEPPLLGQAMRISTGPEGPPGLWVRLDRPLEAFGKIGEIVVLSPRHEGSSFYDVIRGPYLAADGLFLAAEWAQVPDEQLRLDEFLFGAVVIVRLESA